MRKMYKISPSPDFQQQPHESFFNCKAENDPIKMAVMTSKLSLILPWTTLFIAFTQAEASFPSHCLVRQANDPVISSSSCQTAVDQFSREHPSYASLFSNQPSSSNGTIVLPWDRTYDDCRFRVELIYADHTYASTNDVVSAGKNLNTECVVDQQYLGGRIFLNDQGLTLSIRPAAEVDWEERFNESSVIPGSSANTLSSSNLYTVTGTAGQEP